MTGRCGLDALAEPGGAARRPGWAPSSGLLRLATTTGRGSWVGSAGNTSLAFAGAMLGLGPRRRPDPALHLLGN
ncbi:hypothetical protein LV779_27470 [Streptomyces thinghirensis]|nr:hypothetical protein [Streptomyces thinghirensis]